MRLCLYITIDVASWTSTWLKQFCYHFQAREWSRQTRHPQWMSSVVGIVYFGNPHMAIWRGVTLGDYIGLKKSLKNHRKIIVIRQIIGSWKIDSFMWIESILASISFFNYRKFIARQLNFRFKLIFLIIVKILFGIGWAD